MLRAMLRDRHTRRAYVLTKVGVLALAALATWPVADRVGARAWHAYALFAFLLATVTVVVLVSTSGGHGSDQEEAEPEDEECQTEDAVVLPVEDSIDLHPFAPGEIPGVVRDYLEAAQARGFAEVRLIHGRGIGVQRERVRSVLARHPSVLAFHDAPPDRGGWGATVVQLNPAAGAR